jgi:cysteine-rich repeat protein
LARAGDGGRSLRARLHPVRSHPPRIRAFGRGRAFRLIVLLLGLAAACEAATPALLHAHGMPVSLDFWGAFGRRTARCQRVIGAAAASCALRAWEIQRTCQVGALFGTPCDQDAARAAIEAVRTAAVSTVGAACTENQTLTLTFLGIFEAQSDVVSFCRAFEAASVSAVLRPIPDDPAAASPTLRACVEAAAFATSKLAHGAFVSHQYLLDRIALLSFSPPKKRAMVAASKTAIGSDAARLASMMAKSCTAQEFSQTYGRDPAAFLAQIASRADCLAGRTYAQGGILCPAPECGNGMQELPDEDCDDGNVVSGDGCSATCTRE